MKFAAFIASIFNIAEALGEFIDVLSELVIGLLDKAGGGTRPLGFFQSLVRVRMRVRKPLFNQWERDVGERGLFAAGSGRAATDVVWRQAARAEDRL